MYIFINMYKYVYVYMYACIHAQAHAFKIAIYCVPCQPFGRHFSLYGYKIQLMTMKMNNNECNSRNW